MQYFVICVTLKHRTNVLELLQVSVDLVLM